MYKEKVQVCTGKVCAYTNMHSPILLSDKAVILCKSSHLSS